MPWGEGPAPFAPCAGVLQKARRLGPGHAAFLAQIEPCEMMGDDTIERDLAGRSTQSRRDRSRSRGNPLVDSVLPHPEASPHANRDRTAGSGASSNHFRSHQNALIITKRFAEN